MNDIFDQAEARISELSQQIDDLKAAVAAGRASQKSQKLAAELVEGLLNGSTGHLLAADVPMLGDDKTKALTPIEYPGNCNVRTAKNKPAKEQPSRSNVRNAMDRVAEVFNAEPDLKPEEISKKAGVPLSTTKVYVNKLKKKLKGTAKKPEPHSDICRAPEKAEIRPNLNNGDFGRTKYPITPKATGTKFRLLDRETKMFLHEDLKSMTDDKLNFTNNKAFAWTGTEQQMNAVRKQFPATIDCIERVVPQ
ncbi:hypothetical protein MXMO3_01786 [Maritalea myrionectae]|uniref:Uncharacterized protein n=1 Tax=Maritalea myrionectae TaxID=454601 RepID=A0A2R4ME47_9HYPH|nr:hypothetical protein [Maritalea myrionectae]AVX04311.1 hypothetical protein MXMO3_01786 [Maritalea myrionectae]